MKRLSTKNNFELVTLPHNFTNKFQSLNISVNQAVRKFISKKLWYADRVSKQLSSGIAPDDVIVNLKLSDLKSVDANLFTSSHVQSSQKTKRFNNQRFWCCRDDWSDQICKWCLHMSEKSFQRTQTTTFVIEFDLVDCFKWKHEYSQDIKANMIFLMLLSIYF